MEGNSQYCEEFSKQTAKLKELRFKRLGLLKKLILQLEEQISTSSSALSQFMPSREEQLYDLSKKKSELKELLGLLYPPAELNSSRRSVGVRHEAADPPVHSVHSVANAERQFRESRTAAWVAETLNRASGNHDIDIHQHKWLPHDTPSYIASDLERPFTSSPYTPQPQHWQAQSATPQGLKRFHHQREPSYTDFQPAWTPPAKRLKGLSDRVELRCGPCFRCVRSYALDKDYRGCYVLADGSSETCCACLDSNLECEDCPLYLLPIAMRIADYRTPETDQIKQLLRTTLKGVLYMWDEPGSILKKTELGED